MPSPIALSILLCLLQPSHCTHQLRRLPPLPSSPRRSQGAKVINTSFEKQSDNQLLREAWLEATRAGVFFAA